MAHQAALLLLTVHGYEMPDYPVTHDFYRQALELNLRGKREYTEAILAAMRGIDRKRFSHHKALLALSDEALELADRYNIDEFRLRSVLRLTTEVQAEMVQQIIQFNLTGRQVAEMCEKGLGEDSPAEEAMKSPQVRRFIKFIQHLDRSEEDDFVRGILSEEKSASMARARIDATVEFLSRVRDMLPRE
jgi:hypothetical protein